MPAAGTKSPDDIDIAALWAAVMRAKLRLLIWVLSVGIITFAVLFMMTPQYTSVSRILIDKSKTDAYFKPKGASDNPGGASERIDKRAVKSQVEIIGSRRLGIMVAKDLELTTEPEFNAALPATNLSTRILRLVGVGGPRPGQSERDRVLEAYFQRLKVFHIKDTRAIAIQFSSADPKLAAAVANKLSEIYLQAQKTVAVKQTKGARDWLSGEIKKLRKQVSVAEQTAATFRAKAGLLTGSQGNTTLNAQQLSDLNTELSRARVRKSEAGANAKSAREMLRSGTADSAPDILKSQIIQGLVQQRARLERQISELSATLLPAHPRMRQLSADLFGLKRQVRQAVSTIVSGLEKEARVAGLRLNSIQASLDALKQRAANSGGSHIELAALEREAKSKRELLEAYLQRFSDANARRTLKSVNVNAEIYDRAVPTSRPSFPKKVPLTLLSMAAAVLLGLGAVITRALLAGPRALQAQPDVTTARLTAANDTEVGIAHEPQTSQPGYEQPFPYPATSIERLAHLNSIASVSRHLLERGQDRSGFRTMIVGTSLQSDCAADVIELADQLSQAGKQVLIVDWAPAGHELFRTCHLDLTKGLADLTTGAAVFEDVIHGLPGKKAHIICAGTSADQAKMLQDTDCLNLIFDALDETYDHILAYGPFNSARNLFTAMQGRFDTGLLVSDRTDEGVGMAPIAGFLGYDIPDLEIIHFERGGAEHPITMPAANDKHLAAS